jgi:RHS repeat-associated protein
MGVVNYTTLDGEIVSENRGGVKSDYLPDPLGNTVALLNDAQTITDTWTYWPYGEIQSHVGTSVTPYTYVGTLGYRTDVASNFIYVEARDLRPELARWQTADPLWPDERAYAYCSGSPVGLADPSGIKPTYTPPWMGNNRVNYNTFMRCAAEAAASLPACAGKNKTLLVEELRCIAGCETANRPSMYDPFITDSGGYWPTKSQGIGPCRLTTQNRYPKLRWQWDYCANAWGGMDLLCTTGTGLWTGTTPECLRRCLREKYHTHL